MATLKKNKKAVLTIILPTLICIAGIIVILMNRKIVLTVVMTAVICIAGTAGITIGLLNKNKSQLSAVPNKFLEDGQETFTTKEVKNMITSVSELICEKYYYTNIGKDQKNAKKIAGMSVPGTKELTLIVYSGIISAGIDVSQIDCTVNHVQKTITFIMPYPKIIAHEINESSIESYDIKTAVFRKSLSYQDYATKITQFKIEKENELKQTGSFFQTVSKNAQRTLSTLLTASQLTRGYTLVFENELREIIQYTPETEFENEYEF